MLSPSVSHLPRAYTLWSLGTASSTFRLFPRAHPVKAGVGATAFPTMPAWSLVFASLACHMTVLALQQQNNNIGLVQSRHNAEFYGVLTATLALFLRLVFFSGPRGGCIPVLGGEAISAI